jgi:hypothetical protein
MRRLSHSEPISKAKGPNSFYRPAKIDKGGPEPFASKFSNFKFCLFLHTLHSEHYESRPLHYQPNARAVMTVRRKRQEHQFIYQNEFNLERQPLFKHLYIVCEVFILAVQCKKKI